jgi:Concanavalin A-like lectin/glucanases superfamily
VYLSKTTSFSLTAPIAQPASDVTSKSFTLNWSSTAGAASYVVDLATTSDFSNRVEGYNDLNVGNVTSLPVSGGNVTNSPILKESKVIGSKGFILEWTRNLATYGYKLLLSLSSNFSTSFAQFTNKVIPTPYISVGEVSGTDLNTSLAVEDEVVPTPTSQSSLTVLQGLLSSGNSSPKLFIFNDEATLRLYNASSAYSLPAIAENIEAKVWFHVAIVNSGKYTKLYVDGELSDRVRNTGLNWEPEINIGYALTNFTGYLQGFRITYGEARYLQNFTPPSLPLSTD